MAAHSSSPAVDPAAGGRLRLAWVKVRAVSVPVLVSTAVTCAGGSLLPPVPGLVLFTLGLVIGAALWVEQLEPLAVRVLYGGVPLSVADQRVLAPVVAALCPHGLGPPVVRVWVRTVGPPTEVSAAGRRSVLVNRSLFEAISSGAISAEHAKTLLAHAAGLVRSGATRADPFIRFWTIPWVLLTGVMVALAGSVGVAALVQVMWRARWVVTAVAAVQALAASHVGLAVLVLVIGAASYLWPRWVLAWHARLSAIGDEAVAQVRYAARPAATIAAPGDLGTSPGPRPESSRRRHLSVVR